MHEARRRQADRSRSVFGAHRRLQGVIKPLQHGCPALVRRAVGCARVRRRVALQPVGQFVLQTFNLRHGQAGNRCRIARGRRFADDGGIEKHHAHRLRRHEAMRNAGRQEVPRGLQHAPITFELQCSCWAPGELGGLVPVQASWLDGAHIDGPSTADDELRSFRDSRVNHSLPGPACGRTVRGPRSIPHLP